MSGAFDEHLDVFEKAIRRRREKLAEEKLANLRPGDLVRFARLGMGAKYLNGHTAIIHSINWKTAWVTLTPETRAAIQGTRFGRSSRIKVYPGNLDLVALEGETAIEVDRPLKQLKNIDDYYIAEMTDTTKDKKIKTTRYNPDGSIIDVTEETLE